MNIFAREYILIADLLSDDYESVRTLSEGDLTVIELGIPDREIEAILRHATAIGHAVAHTYSVEKQRYEAASDIKGSIAEYWFTNTPSGREHVNENWRPEWDRLE